MATKARFWAYVNAVSTGVTVRLRSASSSETNWGTTIDGTEDDWDSTNSHQHDTDKAISSTGWVSFQLDVAYLALGTGTTWFRVSHTTENEQTIRNVSFRTEEYTGTSTDPYIEVYEEADGDLQRATRGAGT